jgi:hypothetical protein
MYVAPLKQDVCASCPIPPLGLKINKQAYNGYVNGGYEFVLNDIIASKYASLWDFNMSQVLPNYPYAVEADVSTNRSHAGTLIVDYRGDVANIDSGDGIFVRFHIGEAPNSARQAWSLLGVYAGDESPLINGDMMFAGRMHALELYETRGGQLYGLACDELTDPLMARTATIRVEVDAMVVRALIYDGGQALQVTCKRPEGGTATANAPGLLGLLATYTKRSTYEPVDFSLRYEAVRVYTLDGFTPSTESITEQSRLVTYWDCDQDANKTISQRLEEFDDSAGSCVAGGDGPFYDIEVLRYSQRAEQLVGRWQCGSDSEGVIELYKQDWRMLLRVNDGRMFGLHQVASSPLGGEQPHLILYGLADAVDLVKPGDRVNSYPWDFIAYNDADMVAGWLGMCTQLP